MKITLPALVLLTVVLTVTVVLTACGAATVTQRNMVEWGPVLNAFMATNFDNANSYPNSLDEINPTLRADLTDTDGWGNRILYRKLRIDKYNLISAGPDGQLGNDDDIILENGAFYPASKVYAEHPFKR